MTTVVRSALTAAVAVAILCAPGVGAAGVSVVKPKLSATTAVVADAATGDLLIAVAPDRRRPIASTTKLMTALIAEESLAPDEICPAADYDPLPVESQIGLRTGERMRADDLMTALLLESANDAAVTLAECVAGSEGAFVRRMNEQAHELGLDDTSYTNPVGLDEEGNFSTARDLARIAAIVMDTRPLARIVGRASATLSSGDGDRRVRNRNTLVTTKLVDGVKTGYTIDAGNVLVGTAERHGIRVVSAVLGEPTEAARDADTVLLLRRGLSLARSYRDLAAVASTIADESTTAQASPATAEPPSESDPNSSGGAGLLWVLIGALAMVGVVILVRSRSRRGEEWRR